MAAMNNSNRSCKIQEVELLDRINEQLKQSHADKRVLFSEFERWRMFRLNTISAIKKLEDELNRVHMGSSIGRVVGNGVGIAGGLAALIGAGLTLFGDDETKSTGKNLMKVGAGVGILGGVAAGAASAVECELNHQVLKKIKETLEEDERLTKKLLPWFQRAEHIDSLFQEIFDCSVVDNVLKDIFAAVEEINSLRSQVGKTWGDIQDCLSVEELVNVFQKFGNEKMVDILQKSSDKVISLLLKFCNNTEVQKSLLKLYQSFKLSPILFDMLKINISISNGLKLVPKFLPAAFGSSLLIGVAGLVTGGMLQVIIIAINVLECISAADDIIEGNSKYSKMIQDVRKYLLMELKALDHHKIHSM